MVRAIGFVLATCLNVGVYLSDYLAAFTSF
jgi:hypothetical protein